MHLQESAVLVKIPIATYQSLPRTKGKNIISNKKDRQKAYPIGYLNQRAVNWLILQGHGHRLQSSLESSLFGKMALEGTSRSISIFIALILIFRV